MKEESCIKKIIASIVRSLNIKHIGDYLYRLPLQYLKDVSSPMVDDGARWEDIHKTLCWTFLKHTIDEHADADFVAHVLNMDIGSA